MAMKLPESLENVIAQFSKLPGIGAKSASRLAIYMSQWKEGEIGEFSQSIQALTQLKTCTSCGFYSEEETCHICLDEERKASKLICVVEDPIDCLAIENSERFSGQFHVLGGVVNPLIGIGPDELFLEPLFNRVRQNQIEEVILAINPSVEGDATCSYIKERLSGDTVAIQRIGFGIPMGGSLEYLDPLTISKALENRRLF